MVDIHEVNDGWIDLWCIVKDDGFKDRVNFGITLETAKELQSKLGHMIQDIELRQEAVERAEEMLSMEGFGNG